MKKLLILILCLCTLLPVTGCTSEPADTYGNEEITLSLPEGGRGRDNTLSDYSVAFDDFNVVCTKYTADMLKGYGLSAGDAKGAAEFFAKAMGASDIKTKNDICYYDYELTNSYSVDACYGHGEDVWVITFVCPLSNKDTYASRFLDYIQGVTFTY